MTDKENAEENLEEKYIQTPLESEGDFKATSEVVQLEIISISVKETKENKIKRLEFYTDLGLVTCAIKKTVIQTEEKNGFKHEKELRILYDDINQIVEKYPILNTIRKEYKKNPVNVWCYLGTSDDDQYRFLTQRSFEGMYLESYHKENKKNYDSLMKLKEKNEGKKL